MSKVQMLLISMIFFFGNFALATPQLSGLASDASGQTNIFLSYDDAVAYCRDYGWRLPTAREYAEYAAEHGAKGILETRYPNIPSESSVDVQAEIAHNELDHYLPIYRFVDNEMGVGSAVDFYYNSAGFESPSDADAVNLWIQRGGADVDPFLLLFSENADTGWFIEVGSQQHAGARCLMN